MQAERMSVFASEAFPETAFRVLPEMDHELREIVVSLARPATDGFVQLCDVGQHYSARYGKKLNTVLATRLGLQGAVPGLLRLYCARHPKFELRGEGVQSEIKIVAELDSAASDNVGGGITAQELTKRLISIIRERTVGGGHSTVLLSMLGQFYLADYGVSLKQDVVAVLGVPSWKNGALIEYISGCPVFYLVGEGASREVGLNQTLESAAETGASGVSADQCAGTPETPCLGGNPLDVYTGVNPIADETVDKRIRELIERYMKETGQSFCPLVDLGTRYRALYGTSLKQDLAEILRLPPTQGGMLTIYLSRNPGFTLVGAGTTCAAGLATGVDRNISHRVPVRAPIVKGGPYPESDDIQKFAFIDWNALLHALADMALPEPWGRKSFILRSKVRYTFHWLYNQYKRAGTYDEKCRYIYVAKDKQMAAFNLGLVDRTGQEIYLVFRKSLGEGAYWFANGDSVASSANGMRRMAKDIMSLSAKQRPQWPHFLRDGAVAFVNPETFEYSVPYEHLVDRLDRFPASVVRDFCRSDGRVLQAYEAWKREQGSSVEEKERLFNMFAAAFKDSACCYVNLQGAINNAMMRLKTRLKWDYKILVPAYYPTRCTMSLLAPLSFSGNVLAPPDVVAVLERLDSGVYIVQTCLTLDMAYSDARLICRPASEWLVVPGDTDASEEEQSDSSEAE